MAFYLLFYKMLYKYDPLCFLEKCTQISKLARLKSITASLSSTVCLSVSVQGSEEHVKSKLMILPFNYP